MSLLRAVLGCTGLLCGGLVLLAALPSRAQYLQIPDFRHAPPPQASRAQPCNTCGVIQAIRETSQQRSRAQTAASSISNPAFSSGGPDPNVRVGAVMALPMGGTEQAFVGGIGTPEMRDRFEESTYEITIRLDNGAFSVVQRRDGGRFQVGDRVRVQGVNLELIGS